MFLRDVSLPEPSLKMSHLLKHESTVWQTPERLFVRLECAFEVAQDSVAINALGEPCFPELGLERHRTIRGLLHRSTAVRVQIKAIEIELASRDSEAGPRQRELGIKTNRLGIKGSDLFRYFEGLGIVDRDRAQVKVIRGRILRRLLRDGFLLRAGELCIELV